MRSRWRSVVTVVALSMAACGGGGGESADPVGPAPATGRQGDESRARTVVLQQADMPPGWRGSPHNEDPSERERARALSRCLGRPDPEQGRSAIAYGADLSMGQMQVSSIATVVGTVEDAKADLEAVQGPRYHECVIAAFEDSLRQQAGEARIEDVAAEALPVEEFGDGSVGVRLTASLVHPDRTDRLYADLVYISKERVTVSATFFSYEQPFPATLRESLVSRMGNRIETA